MRFWFHFFLNVVFLNADGAAAAAVRRTHEFDDSFHFDFLKRH